MQRKNMTVGQDYAVTNWKSYALGSTYGVHRYTLTGFEGYSAVFKDASGGVSKDSLQMVLGTWEQHVEARVARVAYLKERNAEARKTANRLNEARKALTEMLGKDWAEDLDYSLDHPAELVNGRDHKVVMYAEGKVKADQLLALVEKAFEAGRKSAEQA